jgi:hypothetical protein
MEAEMTFAQDVSALHHQVAKVASKAQLKRDMDAIAVTHRLPNETLSKAFVRIFVEDPHGRQVLKAFNHMTGPQYFAPARKDGNSWPAGVSATNGYMDRGDIVGNAPTARQNYSGDRDDGDGMAAKASFSDLVDNHMRKNPGMNRSRSIDHVSRTAAGAAALRKERQRRTA